MIKYMFLILSVQLLQSAGQLNISVPFNATELKVADTNEISARTSKFFTSTSLNTVQNQKGWKTELSKGDSGTGSGQQWTRKPWRAFTTNNIVFPMESNLNITKRNGRYIEPGEWSPFADEAVPSPYYSNYAANPYGSAMFNPTGFTSGYSPSRGLSPQESTTSKRNRDRDGMDNYERNERPKGHQPSLPRIPEEPRSPYYPSKSRNQGPAMSPPPSSNPDSSPTYGGRAPMDRPRKYSRPLKDRFGPSGRERKPPVDSGPGPGPGYYGPEDYEDGGSRYSYNPAEIPRCAKETNLTYCIEDSEYPIEAMQSEIEKESSLLEQIMPESNEKLELVEGMSKKEDEKYNWRHYFTYRVDELPGHRDAGNGTRDGKQEAVAYGLKPDYYKDGGYICPSTVSYVQPRRAKNVDGMWKIILNLRERYKGVDYKQHVRLEQCMYTGRECSFTSGFYNSHCVQKFNNNQLLAWTEERGIHLDVFKLPVACSCHFRGKVLPVRRDHQR